MILASQSEQLNHEQAGQAVQPHILVEVAEQLQAHHQDKVENEEEGAKANLFVPIRKKRKNNESETIVKMLKIMETMVENDPTKDLLKFMKDDAERSQQTELELLRLLSARSRTTYSPKHSPKAVTASFFYL